MKDPNHSNAILNCRISLCRIGPGPAWRGADPASAARAISTQPQASRFTTQQRDGLLNSFRVCTVRYDAQESRREARRLYEHIMFSNDAM